MGFSTATVLVAVCVVICLETRVIEASHFRGGIITWKPTNNLNEIEITYRMSWRRSSAYCDESTKQNRNLIGGGSLVNSVTQLNMFSLQFYCTDYSVSEDWTSGVRTVFYDTSGLQTFDMYFQSCCWINVNNGGEVGWSLTASVDLAVRQDTGLINSSPITAMSPIIRVQYNCLNTLNIPINDPDGDDVRCRWPNGVDEQDSLIQPTMGMILDSAACTLSFRATSIGWSGVAVVIEDFAPSSPSTPLSKIPLQFLIYVMSSSDPCSSKPEMVDPSPDDGEVLYIPYDEEYITMIRAKSSSSTSPITEIDTVSPQGLTKSAVQQVLNSPTEFFSTIRWTPQASQEGPNIFCFTAVDNHGYTSDQRCITLIVCVFGPSFDPRSSYPADDSTVHGIPNIWEAKFDNEFLLPNETSYIRIFNAYEQEIHSLDTSTSPDVLDGVKPSTLSFFTPGINMPSGEYYVLLEEGVVTSSDPCLADSPEVTDSQLWRFKYVLSCDADYNIPGTFSSPNYPSNYPDRADCNVRIVTQPGQRISLKFNSFHLENCCDSVSVYDGGILNNTLIGVYQGSAIPPVINSTGHELYVWFWTDSTVNFEGFEAEFDFISDWTCGAQYDQAPGVIASPNYPNLYPNNVYCETIITAPEGFQVLVYFREIQIESDGTPNCAYDYDMLDVYDSNVVDSNKQIARICGYSYNMSVPLRSSGTDMLLVFKTDGSVTKMGYEAEFYFVPEPTRPSTTNMPPADLTCADNTMTALVPRTVIGYEVDADNLHFIDQSCLGTDYNSSHVILTTPFDQCGTIMEVSDDHVIFSNIVIDDALPVTPGNVITRDRDMEIPVQCLMEKDGLGSVSFNPDTSKIIYREEGYGKFSFQLQLYPDQSYATPYPPEDFPVDVNLRDMLYIEASVSAEQGLELFVENCVATTSSDPTSSPQYFIIKDGCAADNTLQFYPSADPMVDRFGLEAFAFVDRHTPVYTHCYLRLCNITDPTSRCALGCQSPIVKRDVSKREASGSGSRSYVMTKGPLNFIDDGKSSSFGQMSDMHTSDASSHLVYLIGTIAFCALCLLATVGLMFQSRQTPSTGYMRLASEE